MAYVYFPSSLNFNLFFINLNPCWTINTNILLSVIKEYYDYKKNSDDYFILCKLLVFTLSIHGLFLL